MNGLRFRYAGQRGLTLVELVIAMVVVSIALSGVLLLMNYTTQHSADPMVRRQAVAIVEAYLEEILLKPYNDPDNPAEIGNEGSRILFDDVDDYHGWTDVGARDQNDAPITNLSGYTVQVSVLPTSLNGVAMLRAVVTVTSGSENLALVGYRANY
jgi:MSHA pilin protein MshD